MQFYALEKKSVVGPEVSAFKIVTNGHQHTKTIEDEKANILCKCSYSCYASICSNCPNLQYLLQFAINFALICNSYPNL